MSWMTPNLLDKFFSDTDNQEIWIPYSFYLWELNLEAKAHAMTANLFRAASRQPDAIPLFTHLEWADSYARIGVFSLELYQCPGKDQYQCTSTSSSQCCLFQYFKEVYRVQTLFFIKAPGIFFNEGTRRELHVVVFAWKVSYPVMQSLRFVRFSEVKGLHSFFWAVVLHYLELVWQ